MKGRWNYMKQGSDWALGETSCEQSPIALNEELAVVDQENVRAVALHLNHHGEVEYSVENNGYSVQISAPSDKMGYLVVKGERFDFAQFHFHAPAEHVWTNDGSGEVHRPLELHIVHRSTTDPNRLAVFGITFAEGSSPQADDFFRFTSDERFPPEEGESFAFKGYPLLRRLAKADEEFLTYMGSLTTPPCTDHVQWFLRNSPLQCSATVLKKFTDLLHFEGSKGNFREIQNNADGTPGRRNTQQVYRVKLKLI
eukprot:Polyplicarium_translucidae@DN3301_c0_g1_i1.p4